MLPHGSAHLPRRPVGSGNSLKHGLLSRNLIIPGENAADFEALLEQLLAEEQPRRGSPGLCAAWPWECASHDIIRTIKWWPMRYRRWL